MRKIDLLDASARDGLQNEARIFSVEEKLTLINRSIAAGMRRIEVASFVHPKYVPQMADAEAVIAALPDTDTVSYCGLVLNGRGLDRALATKVHEIGLVAVGSDGFGQSNQGMSWAQSVDSVIELAEQAKAAGRKVNATISTAFGCPFDGDVPQERIVDICKALAQGGLTEIGIADTIGVATPWEVARMFAKIKSSLPDMSLRAHFHNTRNTAVANVYAAIGEGVTIFDASIGGIGGCPFAPNATGNVAMEDLLYMLRREGFTTGLDLDTINATAQWLSAVMERQLPGMVSRIDH